MTDTCNPFSSAESSIILRNGFLNKRKPNKLMILAANFEEQQVKLLYKEIADI